MPTKEFKQKYWTKKSHAKELDIEFTLSFDDYVSLALQSGIKCANQIGVKRDQYQLARYNDIGPYSLDNCRFITQLENNKERLEHFDRTKTNIGVKPWKSPKATLHSLTIWLVADSCYIWWHREQKGAVRLMKDFNFSSLQACRSIISKFKEGWIPKQDKNWINWRDNYATV